MVNILTEAYSSIFLSKEVWDRSRLPSASITGGE